eukprot:Gregarina_sp_Poly_1__3419@NODE_1992_length_2915_cov_119_110955_g1286_i0_p1_GENE_NODE_1992_length_2915_cov_119_110955_g1286_i0NODE_1992_length_2915_cov_119_110955_g1286_i0_p1_ORF_typecomplete_len247_score26_74_NODE_1992_length_2915_cov_119_110955_g1286_i019302670
MRWRKLLLLFGQAIPISHSCVSKMKTDCCPKGKYKISRKIPPAVLITYMKGIRIEQKSTQSHGPLCNALVSCSQILVGNEQYAIQCESPAPPLEVFDICKNLMDYKKSSHAKSFIWDSNDLIRIVERKDYEPARIEPGTINSAILKDLGGVLYGSMQTRNLKLVEQKNKEASKQAACELCGMWKYNWKSYLEEAPSSAFQELLGKPIEKVQDPFQLFYDHQQLFLRSSMASQMSEISTGEISEEQN